MEQVGVCSLPSYMEEESATDHRVKKVPDATWDRTRWMNEMASGDACQPSPSRGSVLVSQSVMLMLPEVDIYGDSVGMELSSFPEEFGSPPIVPQDPGTWDPAQLAPAYSRMLEEESYFFTAQPRSPPDMLPLSSLYPLLTCQTCSTVPITSLTVHTCASGHLVCGNCFSNGQLTCEVCNTPLEGRYEALEAVLQRLRQIYPELFRPRSPKFGQNLGKTLDYSSHRPMKCPHLSCNRVVASNGFFAHFEFEHPFVPVFPTTPGQRLSFLLPDTCVYDPRPQVIALLQIAPSPAILQAKGTENVERVVPCVLLACAVNMGPLRLVAAWCACVSPQQSLLSFTLQASPAYIVRGGTTSYTGRMGCLLNLQDPKRMLEDAQCLTLAPGSLNLSPTNLLLTFHLPPC